MDSIQSFFSLYSYRLFLAGLFLLPIVFVTSAVIPFAATKVLVASLAFGAALIVAVVGSLRRGGLTMPLNWIMLSVWLLPIAYALATLVSPSWQLSVIGTQLDTDTVFFMVLLALAASLPLYLFESRADYARAFFALVASAWLVALFQGARLIAGPDTLSFGIFTSPLFSLLGKWNDLSIFFGFVAVLTLITIEALPLKVVHRAVLAVTLAVSLFFVGLVNFMIVWIMLGIIALGIILYRALLAGGSAGRFSVAPTIVFLCAIVAVVFTSSFGTSLGLYFGTSQIEARPSLSSTVDIAERVLQKSPLFGSGPNTFLLDWDMYRPVELNQSVFWNADFTSGFGFMPTTAVTAGILGILAWLFLFAVFLIAGVRSLMIAPPSDAYAYHLTLAAFAGSLYLLVMSSVYLPSPVLILIGFAILGMFAALQHKERGGRTVRLTFAERPRIGFVAVLGLVLVLVATVTSLYGVGAVFTADVYYERAAQAAQQNNDIVSAQGYITKATALVSQDRLYRLATLIQLAKLGTLSATAPTTPAQTAQLQTDFQTALGAAVENGLAAVRENPSDYRNWQTVGSAYHSVVSLNIQGAYDSAVAAYTKAAALNPETPALPLARAQLEAAKGDLKAARPFVESAVRLKEDYVPALLLLAQIELTDGNLPAAIRRAEAASVFEPSNPVTRFQIGVLKFENKDLAGADAAFTSAAELAPDYANARYYLGRVKLAEGKRDDALIQFREVQKLNPDNTDVAGVISTIEAGGDPFAPTPPNKSGAKK